uniref:Putative secreted protein n=1 Tax=Amblyomma triste TaxID=251400 RepID=A0A023G319_AMBTT
MHRIILVIFSLGLPLSSVASAAITRKPSKPIGDGISVIVVAYYDATYSSLEKHVRSSEPKSDEDPMKTNITTLFTKVENHFNKQQINVKFQVKEVAKNNSFCVQYGKSSLNATGTLQNLRLHAQTAQKPNNTIFFLLTKMTMYEENRRGDGIPRSLPDVATFNTFCSGEGSAAVVTNDWKPWQIMSVAAASASTFGSNSYSRVHPRDRDNMEKTFKRCHH